MEVKLVERNKEDTELSFALNGVEPCFANTIRRLFIAEVPTLAIETVEFNDNSSILYDETIAHRLGLLPIKTDLKSYNLTSECKCEGEGCAQCQLKLTLKAKGPCSVYADDIKSSDPKCKPVFGKTLIVKLLENQNLDVEMTAVLGSGKEHMKWAPGHMTFKNEPHIDVSAKCDGCKICVEKCPVKVLEMKGKKVQPIKGVFTDKCHLCGQCEDACPKKALIVNPVKNNFIFNVESWGQLGSKDAVLETSVQFDKKLDEFVSLVKKI